MAHSQVTYGIDIGLLAESLVLAQSRVEHSKCRTSSGKAVFRRVPPKNDRISGRLFPSTDLKLAAARRPGAFT